MCKIIEQFLREDSIFSQEFVPDLYEIQIILLGKFLQLLIDLDYSLSSLAVRRFVSREYGHQNDPCVRQFASDAQINLPDALSNLFRSIIARIFSIRRIVGSYVQDHGRRMKSVQFAMIQTPEDILGPVPAEAEIKHTAVAECISP